MSFFDFLNKILLSFIFIRVKTCVKIHLPLKLLLLFDSFSLLKFYILDGLRMIVATLPEEVQLVIFAILWDALKIIGNLKVGDPISQVTFFLAFIHFNHKFFNFHSPIFQNGFHDSINVWSESCNIDIFQCLLIYVLLPSQILANSTNNKSTYRFGCVIFNSQFLCFLRILVNS